MIFGGFHECLYRPEQTFGVRGRKDAGGVVLHKAARLQFIDPISAHDMRQIQLFL
jgi:hypothetical protein